MAALMLWGNREESRMAKSAKTSAPVEFEEMNAAVEKALQGIGRLVSNAGIAAGEHSQRSLILDIALALSEDRHRDIARKTKNGLETARRRGQVGGRRPVVDDDKRAAILARRARGESIRTIAAAVGVSIGVIHKTITQPTTPPE